MAKNSSGVWISQSGTQDWEREGGRCGAVARLVAMETREEQGNLGSGDDTDTKS